MKNMKFSVKNKNQIINWRRYTVESMSRISNVKEIKKIQEKEFSVQLEKYEIKEDESVVIDKMKELSLMGNKLANGFVHSRGTLEEKEKALEIYKEAIKEEIDPILKSKILYCMAKIHQYGKNKDIKKAIEKYEESAILGNSFSANKLGMIYQNGIDEIEIDAMKAKEMYEKAISLGNVNAINNLAFIYQSGLQDIKPDLNKAIELLKISANLGNSFSHLNLGLFYFSRSFKEEDRNKGIDFLKKSAELGNVQAMKQLGILFYYGFETESSKFLNFFFFKT